MSKTVSPLSVSPSVYPIVEGFLGLIWHRDPRDLIHLREKAVHHLEERRPRAQCSWYHILSEKKRFLNVFSIYRKPNVAQPLARKRIMASVPSLQILTGGYCSPGSVSTISLSRLWQFPKDLGSFFNLTFLLRSSVLSLFSLDIELGSSLSAFSRRSRLCSLNKSPMESGSFFSLLWCT